MANEVAYGFVTMADVFANRAQMVGMERVNTAILETAAFWSQQVADINSKFIEPTTMSEMGFNLPGGGGMQPLDKDGNPVPVRPTGHYDVGFPIRLKGTAYGTDRITRANATVEQFNQWTMEAMQRDNTTMRREIIKALLWSASWSFTDETRPDDPTVTVQPLANGDTVTYLRRDGTNTTDDHYLAQADAIDDTHNPFPTIFDELYEHPSNRLDQLGLVTVYVASNLTASISALELLEAPKSSIVIPGTAADRVDDNAVRQYQAFGDRYIGFIDGCAVFQWSALPSGYMIAHAPGAGAILKMRQDANPSLQGLFPELNSSDGNHQVTRFLRYNGFGVFNRVGALAYQVGQASYVDPTGYDPSSAE